MAAGRRQWFCMKLSDVYFKFIPHTEGEQTIITIIMIIIEGPGVPDKTLGQIEERYILRTASTLLYIVTLLLIKGEARNCTDRFFRRRNLSIEYNQGNRTPNSPKA